MDQKYFLCGLKVRNRPCWVIGNDQEAVSKANRLKLDGAAVTLVSPQLKKSLVEKIKKLGIHWEKKAFVLSELSDQFLIIFTDSKDEKLAKQIHEICLKKRILFCALDLPQYCDVANVSLYEAGLFKMGISTSGVAPAAAKKIREGLEKNLNKAEIEDYFSYLRDLRVKLEKEIPDIKERRQALMKAVSDFEFVARVTLPAQKEKN